MTIKDVAARLNISHQAVRARIAKAGGQAAGNYTTSSGDLTGDGLQLVADLYFSGDLLALTEGTQDEPTSGEAERLTAEIEQLRSENEQLRSELERVRSDAQAAASEHAKQIVELSKSFAESLANAHRLADQAQQLHAQSLVKPLPWYRRLRGSKTR